MTDTLAWVTAVGSVLTALVTIGLWWVAARTLGGAKDQLQLLQEQVKADSRPYVVVEAVPGLHPAPAWDLVVRNVGRSMARDLRLTPDSWESRGEGDYITGALQTFLATPRFLAPGARLRVMWRYEGTPSNPEAGAPARVKMGVEYADDSGTVFREEYEISLDELSAITPVPSEGPRATGSDKELQNIEKAVRALNVQVGELRR